MSTLDDRQARSVGSLATRATTGDIADACVVEGARLLTPAGDFRPVLRMYEPAHTGSPRVATMEDRARRLRPAGGSSMGWRRSPRMAGLIVVAMNRMPAADVEVSADLVRRLLADQ